MTIEERYELSCYEEISKLHETKPIYLVKHNDTNNLYVKKRIHVYNRGIYERLQQINAVNVPQIIIVCAEDSGELVLVEEYIHGQSLQNIYDKDGLFEEEYLLRIMIALCDILEQLHGSEPPIVHRDIKPSNIMISNDGVVKLIDFNAAKEFTAERVEDTMLMGTQEFAAPEQYGFGQSDQRTDVYAMGITMNYLLTGKYPKQQLYGGKVGDIVKRCTAMDLNRRYRHVGELRNDLKRLLAKTERIEEKKESTASDMRRNIFVKSFWHKEWLPVGFRTGVVWKMVVAVYGYMFIFWCSLTMKVESKGLVQTGFLMWTNRIVLLLWMTGTIFILGNYKNICGLLPPVHKGRIGKKFWTIVYLLIYIFLVVLPLVILENIFS